MRREKRERRRMGIEDGPCVCFRETRERKESGREGWHSNQVRESERERVREKKKTRERREWYRIK